MRRFLFAVGAATAVWVACLPGARTVRAETHLMGLTRGEVLARVGAPAARHRPADQEQGAEEWWLYRGMAVGFGADGAVRIVDGERAEPQATRIAP